MEKRERLRDGSQNSHYPTSGDLVMHDVHSAYVIRSNRQRPIRSQKLDVDALVNTPQARFADFLNRVRSLDNGNYQINK
jgi:hypothetical protein